MMLNLQMIMLFLPYDVQFTILCFTLSIHDWQLLYLNPLCLI